MDQTIHLNQYKIITYQINVSILIFRLKLDLHFVHIRILHKTYYFWVAFKKNIYHEIKRVLYCLIGVRITF